MNTLFFDRTRYPEEADALGLLETPDDAVIIGIDLTAPAEALAALIAARRAGKVTAVFPLLADPLEKTISLIGASIASNADPEQRAQQIAALRTDQLLVNGKKLSELASYQQAQIDAAALALRLADVTLLAAPGEREKWSALLGRPLRRYRLLPVAPGHSPEEIDETGVTIYAPATEESLLAHYAMLLKEHRLVPQIVCAKNPGDSITTRLVITPEWRPMQARALAARGYRVVAPNSSRVDECDSRIFGFTPADYRSFLSAVDAARSSRSGSERVDISATSLGEAINEEAAQTLDGPTISIIIRTYDRPALLARAVASVAAQTYRNVEIVVVNNGGDDVQAIVERAAAGRPFKYEVMPERKHISVASNVGARAASGQYIGYLDDDDLLYADHCARTVEVLERTGADVTFTLCVGEYAQMRGDEKIVLGYQIYIDREYSLDDLYVLNVSPIHSMVHRRDVFDRYGYFDEALPVTDDWEFWLRIASRGGKFTRIDRATCEYSWRFDPERGNMTVEHQWDFVHAYRTITERYAADVDGRASITSAQAGVLAQQEKRAVAAADPANRANIVIGTMSPNIVAVARVPEMTHV